MAIDNDAEKIKNLSKDQLKKRQAALKLLRELAEDNSQFGAEFIKTLQKTADEALIQEIVDFIESDIQGVSVQTEYQNVKSLSIGFQNIWFICIANREICNGGIIQYFINYSYEHLCDTYNSFTNIGASEFASIIEKAIGVISENREYLNKIRKDKNLGFFSDPIIIKLLTPLDSQYTKLSDTINALLVKYVRKNYKDFG